MSIFEQLEDAGHNLCHIGGPLAGMSLYYCEGCGALIRTAYPRGGGDLGVQLFHVPVASGSSEEACSAPTEQKPLRNKLDALMLVYVMDAIAND